MLNIDNVDKVYLACGITDLRRNIDGLTLIVQTQLKLDPFEKALFVCRLSTTFGFSRNFGERF